MRKFQTHRGFSILMAMGIIAVLMIIVTGLSILYIKEMKLSRLSYDEVLSSALSEGVFEYGMLKTRNHQDGFEDTMTSGNSSSADIDGKMFTLSTPRSEGMTANYTIKSQSKNETFDVPKGQHLIVPLFVDDGEKIDASKPSKKPEKNTSKEVTTQGLNFVGANNLFWAIIASNDEQSIALQGQGSISASARGKIQLKRIRCSYESGGNIQTYEVDTFCEDSKYPQSGAYIGTSADKKEALVYFYVIENVSVSDFLNPSKTTLGSGQQTITAKRNSPYLMLYNNTATDKKITITSQTPFSLPQYSIEATAKKGDASQIFRFSEDKSRYYDYLKYGYYGAD